MYAVTIRSGKQFHEPKGPLREEDEGLVKDNGKEIVEEKEDLVAEIKKQGKHEETQSLA